MSSFTMRLLKCPGCGGPIDPTSGGSSTKCPYCGNAVVIPESLRTPEPGAAQAPNGGIFSGVDMGAMMGYGAQWSEVVQLAQVGKKEEAVKKYLAFSTTSSESDARHVVDSLSGAQTYEFTPGSGYNAVQIAPIMASYADTAKTITKWSIWLTCGITAFVMIIVLISVLVPMLGVFAGLWASFR